MKSLTILILISLYSNFHIPRGFCICNNKSLYIFIEFSSVHHILTFFIYVCSLNSYLNVYLLIQLCMEIFHCICSKTVSMRDKEKLHDYRFLPDPNLPPLRLYTDEYRPPPDTPPDQVINVDHLRQQIPILPAAKREHLQKKYDISLDHSAVFIVHRYIYIIDL